MTISTVDDPDRDDIVLAVTAYTALRPHGLGDALCGTCPFCGSSAFHVRPAHGSFHCFRCGEGGDSATFRARVLALGVNAVALRREGDPLAEWDIAVHAVPDTRFVTPAEYRAGKYRHLGRSLVLHVLTDALADAADTEGRIDDFTPEHFYHQHVQAQFHFAPSAPAPALAPGDSGKRLVFDQFTALVLVDHLSLLSMMGLLAHRSGDYFDHRYRLTLPAPA